ncbi:NYN domain-containing protein [bacterium]|nr:NYN domain-containing protein [bacterium]
MKRAKLFIDFWNFTISVRDILGNEYRLDYEKLPLYLCELHDFVYEGAYLYAGIDPDKEGELKLKNFLENTVQFFSGYTVKTYDKKRAKDVYCTSCRQPLTVCPNCGNLIVRKVERSVDVALVTDLLQLAWDDTYDVAFLASADSDFKSAVEFIMRRGKKVIQIAVGNAGRDLASVCWRRIDITRYKDDLLYNP